MDANQIEGRHGHLWSKRQTDDTDSNPTMMNANVIKSILLLPDEHSTSARSLPSACLRYTRRRNKLDANCKQMTPTATPTSTATCQRMSTTETTGRVRRLAKVLLMAFLVCMIGSDSNSNNNNNNQLKSPSFAALAAQVNSNNDNNGGHLATGGSSNGAHSLFDNQASDLATSAGDHRQQLSLLAKSQLPEAHDQNTRGAQQQQQQQQQVACSGACGGPARRGKRHLALAAPGDTELDCHKLSTFWLFLRANYPSLARHLFEWSSSPGGQSDEQFLWARSGQVGRTVARLLDEAERLIGGGDVRPVGAPGGSRGANSWLSRVSSNPAYAKLIQQIQKSKLQQQQQQQHQTSSLRPNYLAPQAHNEQSQQHFGKVVNYPHEVVANAPDNSYGMTRTLNKLRILSDHNRQLNEQENGKQNEQENEQIMSNKIPTINYQDMEANVDLRKSLELADNARNKFVYGNVILRPKQQTTNDEQTKPKKPIDSLRDYVSQEQKQQQQQQQNYHNHKHHQVAEDLSGGRRTDDELMSQQRSQQVASEEDDDNLDEPFPGVVLSSPVKHPEVRQLRSDFGTSTSSDLNGDNIRPLD